MSTVTINQAGIDRFFQTHSLSGRRAAGPELQATARVMVEVAKQLVDSGQFVKSRTGTLRNSFKPIVRNDLLTGLTEVGIGSTAEHSQYIEFGTEPHTITSGFGPRVGSAGLGKPIPHPGNRAYRIMRIAVDSVLPPRGL